MFVSESGICRAPLAAAVFHQLLQDSPLRHWVDVQMRVSEDRLSACTCGSVAESHGTRGSARAAPHACPLTLQATRDYCEGQGAHPAAAAAAARLGISLPQSAQPEAADAGAAAASASQSDASAAFVFEPANDIVAADLVLVMDKFTAADVLREVRVNLSAHAAAGALGCVHLPPTQPALCPCKHTTTLPPDATSAHRSPATT
jgi:hypothetical protein